MRKSWLVGLHMLLLILFMAGSGSAQLLKAEPSTTVKYREGTLLVKYREGVDEGGKAHSRHRHGAESQKAFHDLRLEQVKTRQGVSVADAIREYEGDDDVEYVEPDYEVKALVVPSDPQFSSLWGMSKINAPAAWDNTTGSSSVVVAVIDTGIDYTHSDLKSNIWVNLAELNGKAGVDDDGNGVVDDFYGYNAVANSGNPMDDNSHGTHVAGTIGAVGNNGIGVTGVNWNVQLMACKFLTSTGSGYTSDAIECLQYVKSMKARGVNIVATNNSWGGSAYSLALYDAINAQRDILFITAAGNAATNNDTTATYPADYDLPNVIAVAATTSSDTLASFSNFGRRTVAVGAPGYSILSTLPANAYGYMSGTSMATPHVTGLAALIKAKNTGLDWRGIKNLLLSSGDPVSSLTGTSITGRRINAYNAVTCLDSREFSALKYPAAPQVGVPATLSALSINCAAPSGPVTVALSGGEVINLHDDGVTPDLAAGDGVFSASYTPTRTTESFYFSSPVGSELIGTLLPLSIVTTSLPAGTVGSSYTSSLSATGGAAPYTWSVTVGALPVGLALNMTTGAISGIPTMAGAYSFTVQAKDASGTVAVRPLTLTVAAAATSVSITTSTLPSATLYKGYWQSLSAIGGVKPYTWTVAAGTLPAGVLLSSTGVLSGTPTIPGSFTFTIQAKDTVGAVAVKSLTLTVAIEPVAISTVTLPSATLYKGYWQSLVATGGVKPYVWSIVSGSLPTGIALGSTGILSGTPTVPGTFSFTAQVKDSQGKVASKALSITVLIEPLAITTTTLPTATLAKSYWQGLAASGGVKPYVWSLVGGSLPPGLALGSTGVITGIPSSTGAFSFTLQVRDNQGTMVTKTLSITVN